MTAALARLPVEEPTWLFPGDHHESAGPAAGAAFLSSLEAGDFDLLVLAYGLGMRVGGISQVLRLEPSLVVWRLQRAFGKLTHEGGGEASRMESAVAGLLRGESAPPDDPPPADRGSWLALELVADMGAEVRERLVAGLQPAPATGGRAPGVGVGLVVIILVVVTGFLAFGVARDQSPMWRGEALMRQYEFTQAREAFLRVGTVEARTKIVLCLLAEGSFEAALQLLRDEEVRKWFRQFAPDEELRLQPVPPAAAKSRALLPRGTLTNPKPPFVVRAGPPGDLVVEASDGVERRLSLPDTRGGPEAFKIDYPGDWPELTTGRVAWRIEDGDENPAVFDLAVREFVVRIRTRHWRMLTSDVPQRARYFLGGHHYLNEGLYMQAGWDFARLAKAFPEEAYPRQQVWAVAEALGIDGSALLR